MKSKKILLSLCISTLLLFSFSSCKSNSTSSSINTSSINYLETSDLQKEIVNVNYNDTTTYSSLADVIVDIKPTVVDIYSYGTNFSSAGSGVIVGKSESYYYVITNHHVVDNALSFDVVTYSSEDKNTTYEGRLIGSSPKNDIAVLQISSDQELNIATVTSDSSKVRVGDEVIAIGNPLGILGGSVTHGIISAKEREVYIDSIGYMSLFQTDAAINSGNSGGALFNKEGLLIGIVNSGYSNYEGLNFAIPSNNAFSCFNSIITTYHNNGTNLGYMEGETNPGLNLSSATIYANSSLSSQKEIIYVSSIDNNSDCINKGIKDFASFTEGKYNSFYALEKINDVEISSLDNANRILQNLSANNKVKFTFKEVLYSRSGGIFGQNIYYLSDNIIEIEVTLSQFIYVIN